MIDHGEWRCGGPTTCPECAAAWAEARVKEMHYQSFGEKWRDMKEKEMEEIH